MNKLEQRIYDDLPVGILDTRGKEEIARIAAKIAIEIAEKAFEYNQESDGWYGYKSFEDFKKDLCSDSE